MSYMLSPVRLSSVCLSVTFLRRTQPVEIFGNVSTAFHTLATDFHRQFYEARPRRNPPPGDLNTSGIVKYSDFGPIESYSAETVQDY